MTRKQPLVAIVGPTAVGKTELSLKLAERFDGEIVSADSRLVYKGMDVGTAKPSETERRRVPHHLVDIVEPTERFSLADYRDRAVEAIRWIHRRGHLPFLVGGTGQYVTGLLEGWWPPPQAKDWSRRRELERFAEQEGPQALHARLQSVDPARAAQIDPRNVRRVVRALEIHELTGQPPSRLRRKRPPPFDILRVGLTMARKRLYARIDARIERMVDEGWLDEVRRLLESGVPETAPSMSAIGYRQMAAYVSGELTFDQAKQEIQRASRAFVRRQSNWFKADDPEIHWFQAEPGVEARVSTLIEGWLEG